MASSHAPKRPRLGDRTAVACTACKQKKLKCDGQAPQCQHCAKAGRVCLVEDPATGLHRPRDYLQTLESRVAFLEILLREARPDVAIDHFNTFGRSQHDDTFSQVTIRQGALDCTVVPPDSSSATRPPISPGGGISSVGDNNGNDLASDVALLALNASGREPHYFGPSSALSFSRVASSALQSHKRLDDSQQSVYSATRNSPTPSSSPGRPFPSLSVGRSLSAAYFNHVHPQYPFLHRPTFEAWEQTCLQTEQADEPEDVEAIPLFFVLMVYAIGSLILQNGDRSDDAEAYYAAAMGRINVIIDMDSMESIQAVLACAVYSIRSPIGASIWKLSGMAIRHCIELGYHRNASRLRPNANALTREMSKRTFWVAYDIDRAAAFALGRPFGISDQMIDVELPLDINDDDITVQKIVGPIRQHSNEPPTQMSGAIHVIRLRQLWSKISDQIYSAVSSSSSNDYRTCAAITSHVPQLRQALEVWFAETPPHRPQHSDTGPVTVFTSKDWFRLAYGYTILLLYRHCLTCEYHRRPDTAHTHILCSKAHIDDAFRECATNAREICVLYRQTYQSSPVRYTWGSLHILFLAGLTYLHCLWSSESLRKSISHVDVINTCTSCNMVLVIIAERWSVATSYRDLFEKLSEKTINMVFGGSLNTNAVHAVNTNLAPESGNYPDSSGESAFADSQFQDWLMDLGDTSVPDESRWLVQGLIQGFGGQQDESIFGNLDEPML